MDLLYYAGGFGGSAGGTDYHSRAHNLRGLNSWERAAVDEHFEGRRRVLIISAGAGREAIALHRLGFEIEACECNASLAAAGSRLLAELGVPACITVIERDTAPEGPPAFDALVVGWGGYMLIPGQHRRVALLRQLRQRAVPGAVLLISFFERDPPSRSERITAWVANVIRAVSRRRHVDLGDTLAPNYVHYFTRAQIEAELGAGGFELVYYGTRGYGHAIGKAAGTPQIVA
jgi:hypothetical protein